MRLLAALHLMGNAILLLLGYYWLGLGESSAGLLAYNALVLLFAIVLALWLHGTALVYFEEQAAGLGRATRRVAQNLLPLLVLAIGIASLYWLLNYLGGKFSHQAFSIGSYATMRIRKPVAPQRVMTGYQIALSVLRWVILPPLIWPLAAGVARSGWRGFRSASFRPAGKPLYWVVLVVLLLAALALPLQLLAWVPHFEAFTAQFISFLVRAGVGYLLFVCGLLSVEFVTSSGKPRPVQPSTVTSP